MLQASEFIGIMNMSKSTKKFTAWYQCIFSVEQTFFTVFLFNSSKLFFATLFFHFSCDLLIIFIYVDVKLLNHIYLLIPLTQALVRFSNLLVYLLVCLTGHHFLTKPKMIDMKLIQCHITLEYPNKFKYYFRKITLQLPAMTNLL